MTLFLLKRGASLVVLLFFVSLASFLLFQAGPADPAAQACGDQCTPERIEEARVALGLDKPLVVQYVETMKGYFTDRTLGAGAAAVECSWPCLGRSFQTSEYVTEIIVRALPYTISIAVGASVLWLASGVALGTWAGLKKGTAIDRAAVGATAIGVSLPVPVIGLFLIFFFVNQWRILPYSSSAIVSPFGEAGLWGWVGNYILPWIALAVLYGAAYTRITRGSIIETMNEDYIRTARATGLPHSRVIGNGLRAGLTPVITMFGLDLGMLLGGAVLTETIFSVPGIGLTAVNAAMSGDLPVTMAITTLAAFFIIVMNAVVDVVYAFIDPRVRLS